MATYDSDMKVRPAATWYLVPVLLWVAAIVLALVAWKPIIDLVRNGVQPVGNNASISVPSGGLTIYATRQPTGGTCTIAAGSGAPMALTTFQTDVNWSLPTNNGGTYYGLGSTPSSLSAGTYALHCTGLAPGASLGTGQRIDIGVVTRVGLLGVIVPLILGLIGLVVLIVLLVKRHNSKSRIKTMRASATNGYPGAWGGGGYPPPPPAT